MVLIGITNSSKVDMIKGGSIGFSSVSYTTLNGWVYDNGVSTSVFIPVILGIAFNAPVNVWPLILMIFSFNTTYTMLGPGLVATTILEKSIIQ
ncbi:hypothetical protein SDC9_143603 [bioreactor metagenome]|uniref:Uncharacterized protein n=1 Tax=bioreactor metagenome TaxID=1076179 RepID=A0A645E3V5_9ZZZZ